MFVIADLKNSLHTFTLLYVCAIQPHTKYSYVSEVRSSEDYLVMATKPKDMKRLLNTLRTVRVI